MQAVGESIRKNPEISQAEAKLRNALDHASSTAVNAVREVTKNFADQIEHNVVGVKNTILDGIKEIKNELDISDIIRKNPWESVVTAAVGGSIITYVLRSPKILSVAGFAFKKETAIIQALMFGADLYLRKKRMSSAEVV